MTTILRSCFFLLAVFLGTSKAHAQTQPTPPEHDPVLRIGVLVGTAVLAFAITFVLSGRNVRGLLFIGHDNRYSNSKCQISMWFGALIVSYIATVFIRRWFGGPGFWGSIDIPPHLAALSGLSALTFAAAKGITVSKNSDAQKTAGVAAATAVAAAPAGADPVAVAAVAAQTVRTKTPAAHASFPSDLLHDDDGNFDLGDFQMVLMVSLAFVIYILQIFDFLGTMKLSPTVTLPDVDTTLLAAVGLGQGAYLTKKAVSDITQ